MSFDHSFRRFLRTGTDQSMRISIGDVELPNPVMPASGTYGSGAQFAEYADPSLLGAVVVKSLSAKPWAGHSGKNLVMHDASMLNAVGLANPGVNEWSISGLQHLLSRKARVVASMWGFGLEGFAETAAELSTVSGPIAWEMNLSCPNLHDPTDLIAHSPESTHEVVRTVREIAPAGLPIWAKLSPNTPNIVEVAVAAAEAGANAVTVTNTLVAMVIDVETARPALTNRFGGLSGPLMLPISVAATYRIRSALPTLPIIGSGGVQSGEDAVQLLMAGANAVQVGAANFRDPCATHRVLFELQSWCKRRGTTPGALSGAAIEPARLKELDVV